MLLQKRFFPNFWKSLKTNISRNARETVHEHAYYVQKHDNIWPYGLRALCLFHFLWALSPEKALGVKESEHRQNDNFGSKTAQKRLRNGWGAATPSKTTTIFEPIGVLTRYRTSALKVYWSSSLRRQRIWAPDCNISIENLEYYLLRSH